MIDIRLVKRDDDIIVTTNCIPLIAPFCQSAKSNIHYSLLKINPLASNEGAIIIVIRNY